VGTKLLLSGHRRKGGNSFSFTRLDEVRKGGGCVRSPHKRKGGKGQVRDVRKRGEKEKGVVLFRSREKKKRGGKLLSLNVDKRGGSRVEAYRVREKLVLFARRGKLSKRSLICCPAEKKGGIILERKGEEGCLISGGKKSKGS